MSLKQTFETILADYPRASQEPFGAHPFANFIRSDAANRVRTVSGVGDRYRVEGSPGKGNWASVPWVGIFDRLVTDSAQAGHYLVYLFREDMTGLYLVLGQGVTTVREEYGADAKHALQVRAADYGARLGPALDAETLGPIDLRASGASSLGAFYEAGAIASRFYPASEVPADDDLAADLSRYIDFYLNLSSLLRAVQSQHPEDDETGLSKEGAIRLRTHKTIERKAKLANQAKAIHGYVCQACGFDFEKAYGALGRDFIEAHHLTPLSELKGREVALDPQRDFAVLCSNCHRMIHRSEFVGDVDRFRSQHLTSLRNH